MPALATPRIDAAILRGSATPKIDAAILRGSAMAMSEYLSYPQQRRKNKIDNGMLFFHLIIAGTFSALQSHSIKFRFE
jgi:hypothetical protein